MEAVETISQAVADRVARTLRDAADRLEGAATPREFLAALRANRRVWTALRDVGGSLANMIPPKARMSALAMAGSNGRLPDDQQVELLIDLDRRVSNAIALAGDGNER